MVQPNQLASLLMLGLLGCAWLYKRGWLHGAPATVLAMLLLFGVALTESRTGWLNALVICSLLLLWRRLPGMARLPFVGLGLILFLLICVLALPTLHQTYSSTGTAVEVRSLGDSSRLHLWSILIEAISAKPWFGFGWGQVGHAQFLVNPEKMFDGSTVQNAHNLALDLMLWMGIPLAAGVVILLANWAYVALRQVSNVFQALMLLFVAVLVVHAMLEFPLQYAYFLLPAGLMLGSLNATLNLRVLVRTPRWTAGLVALLAGVVLAITLRDYVRVETSFYGLRFEYRKIKTDIPARPPDVWVLTQWFDYIAFARTDPAQFHAPQDIAKAEDIVTTMPSALGMYKLASMHAFANDPDQAQRWHQILCKVNHPLLCSTMRDRWAQDSQSYPALAVVPWRGASLK